MIRTISTKNQKIVLNTFVQLLTKAVSVILTFATSLLIISRLDSSVFGDLTKAFALTAVGFTAIDFGLNAHSVRYMAGSLAQQRQILLETIFARLVLSIVVILVINIFVLILPGGYAGIKAVYWVSSLSVLFQGLYTSSNAWFQRRLEYWKTGVITVLGTGLGTILTYLVITRSPSLQNLLLASTLGYITMAIFSLFFLRPILSPLSSVPFPRLMRVLKSSLPLGLILIASIISSKIDTVILGIFRPSYEVGQYGFAYRIFDVALTLPTFVMNAVYPSLIGLTKRGKTALINKSSTTLLVLGFFAALALISSAPFLSHLRGEMSLSIKTLQILALSLPIFYLTSPLMWGLIEQKLERQILVVYAFAAIFNGLSNYLFVPLFGSPASAVLTIATETIILTGLVTIKKRAHV